MVHESINLFLHLMFFLINFLNFAKIIYKLTLIINVVNNGLL